MIVSVDFGPQWMALTWVIGMTDIGRSHIENHVWVLQQINRTSLQILNQLLDVSAIFELLRACALQKIHSVNVHLQKVMFPNAVLLLAGVRAKGVATGPKGVATGPKGVATGPKGVATSPKDVATGPKGVATGPKDVATGPKGVAPGPKGVATERQLLGRFVPPSESAAGPNTASFPSAVVLARCGGFWWHLVP